MSKLTKRGERGISREFPEFQEIPGAIVRLPEEHSSFKTMEPAERWMFTDPEVLARLSEDMRSYVNTKILKYREFRIQQSKGEFAKSRIKTFKSSDSLFPEGVVLTIVVLASGVVFGAAPQQLADAAGRGALAAGAGLVGGMIAGFLADYQGKRVLTGFAMKKSYVDAYNHQKDLLSDCQAELQAVKDSDSDNAIADSDSDNVLPFTNERITIAAVSRKTVRTVEEHRF